MPSDHYVRDLEPFAHSIAQAVLAAKVSGSAVLIGAVPDRPESEYGWMVADPNGGAAGAAVARFEEKPPARLAQELFESGALWNTFIMVGAARCLWRLALEHLPAQAALLEQYAAAIDTQDEYHCLRHVYRGMAPADFSRDVLHKAKGLRAVTLKPCGWSDWGTPERVLDSLRGSHDHGVLVQRLGGHAPSGVWVRQDLDSSGSATSERRSA